MKDSTRRGAWVLYACLFASGAAGLIYEVLWAKYLALYVGSTGLAQAIVLATFMGGMAIGSYLFGRMADRCGSPLRWYAYVEFGIGVYGVVFGQIAGLGREIFIALAQSSSPEAAGLLVGKIAAAALTILAPAVLMGGTLPLLGRHLISTVEGSGPTIARLYFLNSLGAVLGCLAAGFWAIPALGLDLSLVVAAGLNIGAGLASLGLAQRVGSLPKRERADSSEDRAWPLWSVLAAAAISGAAAMMYEVAWIRMLALVLGSSTYSFSLMLATFILGLALGGLVLSLRRKPRGYGAIFGVCSIGVGLSVLASLPFYARLPYLFNQIACSLSREPATFWLYQLAQFFLCALVMIVPTILQGVTLPAAAKSAVRSADRVGISLGLVFALNTLGTIGGTIFATFWGLPKLGIKGTLELAVMLNVVVGLAVLWAHRGLPKIRPMLVGAIVVIGIVSVWYAAAMGPWDRKVFAAGVYRTRTRIPSFESLLRKAGARNTLFYRDGVDATIAVQDQVDLQPQRTLVINGKVDASTVADLPTQKAVGHLPILIHPAPKDALIVGLGSGATVAAVLSHDIGRVDVVEISGAVIEAAKYFKEINGAYWKDPRARLHQEDAKTFLQVVDHKYDVIISEPSNPWVAGIAGVFSEEYYATCRSRLAEGGIFAQWIQTYELEDKTLYLMLETFRRQFPYYTVWNPGGVDLVVVGSAGPYGPDFSRMRAALARRAVKNDLEGCQLDGLLSILATQMLDRSDRLSQGRWSPLAHSDYFPILEYLAPRGFFLGKTAEGASWIDQRNESPVNARLWAQSYLAREKVPPDDFGEAYRSIRRNRSLNGRLLEHWAREWAARVPDHPEARLALGAHLGRTYKEAEEWLPPPAGKKDSQDWRSRSIDCQYRYDDYVAARNCLRAPGAEKLLADIEALFKKYSDIVPDPKLVAAAGQLQFDLGRYKDSAASLAAAAAAFRKRGEAAPLVDAGIVLCRALRAAGNPADARAAFAKFLQPYGRDPRVWMLATELEDRALP